MEMIGYFLDLTIILLNALLVFGWLESLDQPSWKRR